MISSSSNRLKIKFQNETGFRIDSLVIGNKYLGALDPDEITEFIIFNSFKFDTGFPDENCIGYVKDELYSSYNKFYTCGTQKFRINDGKYEMSIHINEYESVKYLKLDFR